MTSAPVVKLNLAGAEGHSDLKIQGGITGHSDWGFMGRRIRDSWRRGESGTGEAPLRKDIGRASP